MSSVNTVWQLEEAKNLLSDVVERALRHGAQTITRHGQPVVVVVAAKTYNRLRSGKKIVDVLRACPTRALKTDRLR